ncbi:MAG TPA: Xaa-Pro peptidase family protein, partial [Sphingorhabdus sp.]|nr:Xaa-Pro peptidase family protein [Sphingorhabdus sp.]
IRWWRSERTTVALIPVDGRPCIFTPYFEEPSIRESLGIDADVRTWNENEDPQKLMAAWLAEQKLAGRPVGIEETVRHFITDGLRAALPDLRIVSGAPVVRGCRMHKTAAEIALMQAAADITAAAFKHSAARIEKGMAPDDIQRLITDATVKLGGEGGDALILLGEASAYPHGSGKPQEVRDGDVILIDGGCSVHDYVSDISRSFIFSEPTKRQREVWSQMRQGQQIAIEAAQIGVPAGSVDDKVWAWYTKIGYGPAYKLPGLSHRTGHGIGMDGHEPVNLVQGEATLLAEGMCFSNEPGIYIPGSFGIRLEDCFHMTAQGPKWFTTPPPSIDKPFG